MRGLSLRARAPGHSSDLQARLRVWLWSRCCERPSRVARAPAAWAGVAAPGRRVVPMCSAGRSRWRSRQEKRKHSKASQVSPFLSWPQRKRGTPCSHACHAVICSVQWRVHEVGGAALLTCRVCL